MSNTIKQQHDAFKAYGVYNDWMYDEPKPIIEICVSNGTERGYVALSIEEAEQAIDLIKDAIKGLHKEVKKIEKRNAKRVGRQRF